jgi:hypothetical protein
MGIASSIGREASNRSKTLYEEIEALEKQLTEEAHCSTCKFMDTKFCGGMLDRETLVIPTLDKPVFCTSYFDDEKTYFFNIKTIQELNPEVNTQS